MSIDPHEIPDDDEVLVASFATELAQVTDADQAIAAMNTPRVPTGGRTEEWVKPTIETVTTGRDWLRRWTPALAGTILWLVLLFAPLTGPLIVWTFGLALTAIWTSFGRPGPRDTAALIARHVATVWGWITTAWTAISGFLRRGEAEPEQRPATA